MFQLTTLEEYSDDALLAEIKRVVAALDGKRLTRNRFNEMSCAHSSTVSRRFGSWRNALDLAGIDEAIAPRFDPLTHETVLRELKLYAQQFPDSSPTAKEIASRLGKNTSALNKLGVWRDLLQEVGLKPVPFGRRYTDEQCFENIVALWTYYGRQPNFAELKQSPSTVGSKAYVKRWGGWRAALAAFIRYVNQPGVPSATETTSQEISAPSQESVSTAAPRSMSLSLRYKVLCRDHFKCVICGRSPAKDHSVELHVDHIQPWSKGGRNSEENLRTLCFECNLGKGAKVEST